MKKIQPDTKKRRSLGAISTLFLVFGCCLFPTSIFAGIVELIPLMTSSILLIFSIAGIYISWFYEIIIDSEGILIGNAYWNTRISKEQIEGYFLLEEPTENNRGGQILVLCLKGGDKKTFDTETLGKSFAVLVKEISQAYSLLPSAERDSYLIIKKKKGLQWASYLGLAIFTFGIYLLIVTLSPNLELKEIEGSLKEQPVLEFNRHQRASRIIITLNEFPDHSFSQVKNVQRFQGWADQAKVNDRLSVEVSQDSYDRKILETSEPGSVILNYDLRTLEIKSLKDSNQQSIYQENRFARISLPVLIALFGAVCFLYYQRKNKRLILNRA